MKICYVNEGIHLQDHIFLKFFRDRGHEVHLVSFCSKERMKKSFNNYGFLDGLETHHHKPNFPRIGLDIADFITSTIWGSIKLKKVVKEIKPDILNGHWLPTYGFYSAVTGFHPFLLTIWGSDVLLMAKQSILINLMSRFEVKKADAVIVDSTVQEEATLSLGCDKRKIIKFPWAADTDRFNPSVPNLRKKFGLGGKKVIIYTRWHEPVYDPISLIKAIPKIVEENKDAVFMILGSGTLTSKMKSFVRKSKVEKNVIFVGNVPWDEMPKYMNTADIYVSTSLSDGSSAALLEAMACGKAVAVSDIPANREWVKNNWNGVIFQKEDPDGIGKSLLKLLENKSLAKRFGSRNLKIVKDRASLKKGLKLYEKTMLHLVK